MGDDGPSRWMKDALGRWGPSRISAPALILLTRFGIGSKGVVHFGLGGLALLAAVGLGGKTTDLRGVLGSIFELPFGSLLVLVAAVGMAAFGCWRTLQGLLDFDHVGAGPKGLVLRGSSLLAGLSHWVLVVAAYQLVSMSSGPEPDGEARSRHWAARLLSHPLGDEVLAAIGLGVLASGALQLKRAASADFLTYVDLSPLSPSERKVAILLGRLGFAAYGTVFAVIGTYLLVSAWFRDPNEARGMAGALRTVGASPYGPYLLGALALGLVAQGGYMLVEARYRCMKPPGREA